MVNQRYTFLPKSDCSHQYLDEIKIDGIHRKVSNLEKGVIFQPSIPSISSIPRSIILMNFKK